MIKRIYLVLVLLASISMQTYAQKDYESYVKDALTFTEKMDYPAAELSYKAAMRAEPTNPSNFMLMVNLGTIQRYLEKYEEALISYNTILLQHPNLDYVLKNRARLYCDMNQYEEALKDYTSYLLKKPNDTEVLYDRGLVYIALRDLNKAEGDFKNILAMEPDNNQAQSGIAMIMKRRGQWEEAEQLYSDLIAENRRNGELYANRAECYLNLKKLRSMSEDLDKAIEYEYNSYSVYILKGQLKLEQYEKQAAKADFVKAQEMGANEELIKDFLLLCK